MSNSQKKGKGQDEFPAFLNNDGKIRAELLDKDALYWAQKFRGISTHQIRRFFDEVKKYEQQLSNSRKDFNELKPLIYMLKSKAQYAAHKQNKMNPFAKFISNSIDEIKKGNNEKEEGDRFKAFCLFFEAVYGFAELKK